MAFQKAQSGHTDQPRDPRNIPKSNPSYLILKELFLSKSNLKLNYTKSYNDTSPLWLMWVFSYVTRNWSYKDFTA